VRELLRQCRDALTAGLARDLVQSVRLFVTNRGFSGAVVLTLAVCLGANAAIFSVVDGVLLQPLPVPEPDRIVGIGDVYPTITPNDVLASDVPSYFDRRKAVDTIDEHALFTFWFDTLVINGVPEELRGMRVTPSLFRVVGVRPALGRAFTDAEGESGAELKLMLSHGLWQRLYGGDPSVIGQSLRLGWTGQRYTIVGVMPDGFAFFEQGSDGHAGASLRDVQFWIPLALTPAQKSDSARTRYGFFHIGRLRPGVTLDQVQAQIDALHAETVARFPQFRYAELGMYPVVTPLHEALTRDVRSTLYLLWGGAGFVLLIGALNLASLALARASVRARELATRLALGARRLHVTRQLVVEAMVPSIVGGAAALAVAAGLLQALALTGLENLPNAARIQLSGVVVALIVAASALVGLLIGLLTAAAASALTINLAFADGSRAATGGRSARALRRALVVAQVALSVVLLIAATLLFASLRHLLGVDAGFSAARVMTATIFPPPSRYPTAQAVVALSDQLLERVRRMPGVEAAGLTTNVALSGFASPATVSAANGAVAGGSEVVPSVVAVTPGYFEAMGTRLVRGRYFTDNDHADSLSVAIVDERLASRLWPSQDALGQRIHRGDAGPFTVVGVVREVRFESVAATSGAIGTAYFAHAQAPPMGRLRWLAIKTVTEPAAVVRAVRAALIEVDPHLPLSDVQTMDERRSRSLVPQTMAMTLATLFALVALFLSLLGIYGVLTNAVARRTREFGIRIALGSSVHGVFRLVLQEGVTLVGLGLLLGLMAAVATGKLLEGHVFGVQATDPLILGGVAIATGGVALAACLAPARRATRVDPVDVLSRVP
jgi:predicted permease